MLIAINITINGLISKQKRWVENCSTSVQNFGFIFIIITSYRSAHRLGVPKKT